LPDLAAPIQPRNASPADGLPFASKRAVSSERVPRFLLLVTPGLDPGVHGRRTSPTMDGRVKPGHDGIEFGDGGTSMMRGEEERP
jgi:hypothetical protein